MSVAKFFIDNVGMNGFSFVVPWATPAPIGIFITTNFQLIALVFVAIIILLDAIIYLPFLKAYDKLLCDQEAERAAELGPSPMVPPPSPPTPLRPLSSRLPLPSSRPPLSPTASLSPTSPSPLPMHPPRRMSTA